MIHGLVLRGARERPERATSVVYRTNFVVFRLSVVWIPCPATLPLSRAHEKTPHTYTHKC
jgi:hypothetical protein